MKEFVRKRFWYKIVYVGNGATEIVAANTHKNGWSVQNKNGSGAMRFSVTECFIRKKITAGEWFCQQDAVFLGYYIRKKHKKSWEWYCTDGTWNHIETIVEHEEKQQAMISPDKMVNMSDLQIKRGETVYFVAQWEHAESKERMDCGYWVFRNPLMAHALGMSENGKTYQNTYEAFERSYQSGYRYFEVDVALTEDEKLVCCHGWSEKNCQVCGMEYQPEFEHMTYELFMKQTVNGNPVMDIHKLYEIMQKYPDTYFEIDLHKDNYEKKIELLVEEMENDESLLDRLLIQAQGRPIYRRLNGVHHFLNNQVIAGESWMDKMDGMISFALEHGLCAIALRKDLAQKKQVQMIRQSGIYVLAYTVKEDVELSRELLQRGVSTICADGVLMEDILDL